MAPTYRRKSGLGVDSFHPKWLACLSAAVLQGLAMLLDTLEGLGIWPAQIKAILIAQLPKKGGGRRLVGLLPWMVRT